MAKKYSFLGAIHTNMIDVMYEKYMKDPESINNEWRQFFTGFDFSKEIYSEDDEVSDNFKKEFQVINYDAYREVICLPIQTLSETAENIPLH